MKRKESYLIFLRVKENPRKKRLKIKRVLDLELHVATRVKKKAYARYIWDGYISIVQRKDMCLFVF